MVRHQRQRDRLGRRSGRRALQRTDPLQPDRSGDRAGAEIFLFAGTSATATGGPIEGNVITGCQYDGLEFNAWADSNALVVPSELGGGSFGVIHGRNSLLANGATGFSASGPAVTVIGARGNWWGTTDPLGIEARVRHQADDPARPLADFSDPLDMALDARLSRQKVKQAGGSVVVVTARSGSASVPFAGTHPLTVTPGGRAVSKLTVSPKGRRLGFKSPGS